MALLPAILIACLPVLIARHYWQRLGAGGEWSDEQRLDFLRWLWLGAIIPVVLWAVFNLGLLGQPVWPSVQPLSAGLKAWHQSFNLFSFTSTLIIISYWAGLSFTWLLCRAFNLARGHRDFSMLCGAWGFLLVPLAVLLIWAGGWWLLGVTLTLCTLPLVHMALNLKPEKKPAPSYSRAIVKLNYGRYDEAEKEVIRELEEFEEDFDGWMMLAELYATQFNDLPGADQTVRDLCAQPKTTPVQISIALHRLADWQLKHGRDPVSARAALEEICARMPGTHLERMARQRVNQLPATREELEAREAGKPVHLPHIPDESETLAFRALSREQALAEAGHAVETLQKNPDDVAAREEFARVLADNLGEAGTAMDQIELLLAMPNQPVEKRGHWLLLLASWHLRHRNDPDRARLLYEEVVRDFEATPHAFAAQRRLHLLNMQQRIRRRALSVR
jgi:tetratricopeptide (TPR) repeat protein